MVVFNLLGFREAYRFSQGDREPLVENLCLEAVVLILALSELWLSKVWSASQEHTLSLCEDPECPSRLYLPSYVSPRQLTEARSA